ncbi:DUF3343 domain-containing protein [Treponema denticola]|uniref:Putative Se/S carrier protein-like domain-containing protein n=1 Tax=Treponema denticola SP33 TaxID=999437 RepID=M2BJK7_TREDN|nr:DUF3343 domain-containing protein [Treponema denticola]EMB25212.1 hypothetical protein HMPREF9733_01274 [Treponema denticola SP33]EPF36599.1 hypothetical protein HMPREF9732_00623 [Treponema denticola SP32]
MKEYLLTFHTHYDSLVCMRAVNKTDNAKAGELTAKLVPVPRSVSSSCGTALKLIFKEGLAFDKDYFSQFDYDAFYSLSEDSKYVEV